MKYLINKKWIVILLTTICTISNSFAQKHYYEGGFFEKKGNIWYDYKDENPTKGVNSFKEISSDANFYVGDNGQFKVAIPKSTNNDFLFQLKDSNKWKLMFPSKESEAQRQNRLKYYYDGGHFEKKGNYWIEFKESNSNKAVNWFTEVSSDKNFYVVDNGNCKIAIPKDTKNNFLIQLKGSDEWKYLHKSKIATSLNKSTSSIIIEDIKIEYDVLSPSDIIAQIFSEGTYQSNDYGINFCVKVTINNMLNKRLDIKACFYDKYRNPLKDGNNKYRDSNGHVIATPNTISKPINQNYVSDDIDIFIPYSEFHCKKGTSHDLKFRIQILDAATGKCITESDYIDFTLPNR